MTATLTRRPDAAANVAAASGRPGAGGRPGLAVGVVVLWLGVLVALPLAALTVASFGEGVGGFVRAATSPGAVAALRTTLLLSAAVAILNAVVGTVIAWVLARDEFPGKRIVDALIDLPFALPTIVTSIVLLSLYGPNSPIGVRLNATPLGVAVALAFVTLPFVVRSVQPVLAELDREAEEAAASLGASNPVTFKTVIWPAIRPAVWGARRWRSRGRSASSGPWRSSAATSPDAPRWPASTSPSASRSATPLGLRPCRSRCWRSPRWCWWRSGT